MPRKSAINRGSAKMGKLLLRIYNTIKAHYPNVPDEVAAQHAAQGVYKYALALGYYEGRWRAFTAYLRTSGEANVFRHIMGPLRSAVIKIAKMELSGASDTEILNTIEGLGLPDEAKKALKKFFVEAKA
jgi:hypothetical protein